MLVLPGKNLARGMSGGPVLDVERGVVVGLLRITDQKTTETTAIPAATVVERWGGVAAGPDGAPSSYAVLTGRRPVPEAMAESAWAEFDPNTLHCVVLSSERLAGEKAGQQLVTVVERVRSQPRTGNGRRCALSERRLAAELPAGFLVMRLTRPADGRTDGRAGDFCHIGPERRSFTARVLGG